MRIYKTEDFMKSSKSLHIFKCSADPDFSDGGVHTHDFIEIVYVLSGEMTHEIDGCRYRTAHGDMLFMNYGCTHTFFAEGKYTYVNILFSPELMGNAVITAQNAFSVLSLSAFNEMRSAQDSGCVRFFGKERDEIETIILSMLDEYEKKQTSWETVLGNLLTNLIIKMLRKTELGIGKSELRRRDRMASDGIRYGSGVLRKGADGLRACPFGRNQQKSLFGRIQTAHRLYSAGVYRKLPHNGRR